MFFPKGAHDGRFFLGGKKKQQILKGLLSPLVKIEVAQNPEIQNRGFYINTQIMFFFQKGQFFWEGEKKQQYLKGLLTQNTKLEAKKSEVISFHLSRRIQSYYSFFPKFASFHSFCPSLK